MHAAYEIARAFSICKSDISMAACDLSRETTGRPDQEDLRAREWVHTQLLIFFGLQYVCRKTHFHVFFCTGGRRFPRATRCWWFERRQGCSGRCDCNCVLGCKTEQTDHIMPTDLALLCLISTIVHAHLRAFLGYCATQHNCATYFLVE